MKYVRNLLSITACGEHCVLATRADDSSGQVTDQDTNSSIHLIPKWSQFYYSFVYFLALVALFKGQYSLIWISSLRTSNKGEFARKQNNTKMAAILEWVVYSLVIRQHFSGFCEASFFYYLSDGGLFPVIFQHVLVLCNAIGTPLDSKYIEIGKQHLRACLP